jgi:hypothetical protein
MPAPALMRARDPDKIRAAMAARGQLTLRELAAIVRITDGMISFILKGQSTSRDVAKRIARTLKSPVDDLFVPATSNEKQLDDQSEAVA